MSKTKTNKSKRKGVKKVVVFEDTVVTCFKHKFEIGWFPCSLGTVKTCINF